MQKKSYWQISLETGFEEIDAPHREFAEFLPRMEEVISKNEKDAVLPMLGQIIAHLEANFPAEEQLMENHRYPLVEGHKSTHQTFIRQLKRYETRHGKGEDIARNITYDLKIWLTNHIKLQDGDFARFARSEREKKKKSWLKKLFS